jgi:DNA polymerase-3 subunit delta'
MSFKDIIGHERPLRLLQRAVLTDHLPHAYLWSGPEGIGKRLTALTLAKALNCNEGREDCCDTCIACKKIDGSNHPDVSVIQPDGQFIKIDAIRQLQRSLNYRPYEGRRRVCILDGADRMKAEGANALLKTLEEPPADTLLILLATQTTRLLPTIVSRCQEVRFTSLPVGQVVEELTSRLSMGGEEARTLAELSQGSLGKALEIQEQEVWQKRPEIIQDLMELPSKDIDQAFALAQSLKDLGENLTLVFPMMISWYRDLIIWNEFQDVDRLINQDLWEKIEDKAVGMTRRSLGRRIEAIHEASNLIERNVNPLLTLENLVLQLR